MKESCLYFDKKYKCLSFKVHYKGITLSQSHKNKEEMRVTLPSPLRTAYRPISALCTAYRHFSVSRTAYRF